ncbi:MoxR family ATPase [Petroclostridium sp. X23]|uniref:AAA family ATPase n=1 Tax=Petroclostridium sp. X23 TaxID=3045146 RepID=UPI0024AE6865|nr:MoxR family ATPase [Petroclostridium sp. X23]WHH58112.1 MoxR family ATPase [Petroclostridium sp. X23]
MNSQKITANLAQRIQEEAVRVIVGQQEQLQMLLVCLFSGGHVLIEGVPGLGKTLTVRTLAAIMDVAFHRIQFTPDMMPSDIIGTNIFDMNTQTFHLKKGPLFTNFLLADEINRTPPKTQSALLEAMEEGRVSIDGSEHILKPPFMVFATQNPIEFEGTYPLPEAQLDRFLMKILIDYPEVEAEKSLLLNYHKGFNAKNFGNIQLNKVADGEILQQCKQEIEDVTVEENIINYIMAVITATRQSPNLLLGASPRASIALLQSAKTLACMEGRDYVIPDDVKYLAAPILRHRLIVAPEAEIEGIKTDDIIKQILNHVKVPR